MIPADIDDQSSSPGRNRGHSKDEQAEATRREEQAKREQKEKAAAELAAWHEQRQRTLATIRDAHRMHPPASHPETGSPWERVAGLVEAIPQTSTKDLSKFKSLLVSLKNSPPVVF